MIRRLARQANLPMAATEEIMRIRSAEELKGFMAHELAHMQNHDKLISSIAATFADTSMLKLFSTRPPMEECIARLEGITLSRR